MNRFNKFCMAYVIIFFGVSITSIGQNHARIQNCIAVHELIDNRIHFEREQALFSVYQNASFSVISSWLDIGSSVFKTWGGILEFTYNAFSLNDHMVSIDLIERLYWERIYQASQDLNNCINFS